ncbi:hypothetical protein ACFPAF_14565 [Hymenobacter endophyticus]|uniref:DUF2141 domain-containing protein n=1 Tax=Hymenobacter endophyticus TaxID=3076335 RepID=A0ABU3TK85_9BACT|nr:hypothetical protein [Hymenobacter endophyticus]MDU0371625.1 hypothetical protein [Hymenobacter endophyticus]
MVQPLFFPLLAALLCLATSATAQTTCARPIIQLLHNEQPIAAAGSALVPVVTLRVEPEAGCPAQEYRFRHAQVTLVRRGRPVLPSKRVQDSELNLQALLRTYQTGDHLLIFIAYQDVALVSSSGTLVPLATAKDAKPKTGQLDLRTDDSKGISFRWLLQRP